MSYIKYISAFLVVTLSARGQTSRGTQTKNAEIKRDHPAYIIFGVFCGECSGHCATMYRYNIMSNSNTLFVDSTDSYFKNHGKVVCKTQIKGIGNFQIIDKLVQQIPKTFFKTNKTEQTFGCPDCTDGCGIYFEVGQATGTRKFYVDYDTKVLGKEVRDFGELVKEALAQLNRRK